MLNKNILMALISVSLFLSACSVVKKGNNQEDNKISLEDTINKDQSNAINSDSEKEEYNQKDDDKSSLENNVDKDQSNIMNFNTTTEYRKKRIDLFQSVQENGYYCVPACVQMVLQLHGIAMSQVQLAQEMNTHFVTGTEYTDLAKVINKYRFGNEFPKDNKPGYRVQTLSKGVWNQEAFDILEKRVKEDIATNDPIFIAIELSTLYPELGTNANHMVLLTGYQLDKEGNISSYYIVDPYYKVQDSQYQGLKIFSKNEIYQALINNTEPAYVW